jgi:hypothetical protein
MMSPMNKRRNVKCPSPQQLYGIAWIPLSSRRTWFVRERTRG